MGFIDGALSLLTSSFSSSSEEPREPASRPPVKRKLHGPGTVVILVVGRSGSGKTSLIDAVCFPNPSGVARRYRSTTKTASYRAEVAETKFKLIDTPGFDHVEMSDLEVCTKIAEYFWEESKYHLGINGIVYIHRAGDPLRSRSLRRYLTVLSKIFLGNDGMRRLTIFIPHIDSQGGLNPAQTNEDLRDNGSILGEASTLGARIICGGGLNGFTNIIKAYRSTSPIVLPIQDYNQNLVVELDKFLHDKPIQLPTSNQDARVRASQQKLDEVHSILDAKERELVQYRDAYHQIKNLHDSQQNTEATLRQQLQQIQHEYASLRSELQIQENFEQSEIVQELEDLNRQIDDIARTISAYLTDNHVRAIFGKDSADVTALEARNLPGLLKLLQCDEGKCSLISSEGGEGLDVEGFLDFTIRDMLCNFLVAVIFEPFHPAIDSKQSETLLCAYEDIQKRESQTKSGKWRSTTFKSIHKDDNPNQVAALINHRLALFARMRLNPLLTYVFGTKDATMTREHFNQMHELVKRAWDWNSKLKGEVVVLGDFRQTLHSPGTKFDPNAMNDFEPRPNRQPISVLGTVGLGLISLRAVGGGQPPEKTLVCKATVTTNTLYA